MKSVEIIFWIFAAVVFYTYAGYGIVLYIAVKIKELFCKPKPMAMPDPPPSVTLLIAAYNEEKIVREKMANCLALEYPGELDIMWVTDGSTDRTNDLLEEYPGTIVIFSPERRGKTPALNHSMRHVRTDITVFTDANTMLGKDAITNIVRRYSDPEVGCVAGEKRVADLSGDSGMATQGEGLYWRYESTLKDLDSRLYSAVGAAGELFSVRTDLLEELPDNTLLDDFVLSMRIASHGYKIAYAPDAYALEGGSADMNEERKRKTRISGGGLQAVWSLLPLLNPFRYGVLTFQYFSHRVLRWTFTPIMLVVLLPLNIALVIGYPASWLYWILLAGQAAMHVGALIGQTLARKGVKKSPFLIPYYFMFMNYNVFLGMRYIYRRVRKGVTIGAWETSKRA